MHIRETLALAAPIALFQVTDMLTVTADTVMVGHLGSVPLAAAGLANAATIALLLFSVGFTVAITPLAGEAWGADDLLRVKRIGKAGFMVSMAVICVITLLLLAGLPWLHLLKNPPAVTEAAKPYYVWIVLSFIPRIAFGAFKQTAEAMSDSKIAMIIAIVANVVHIGVNYVLVNGKLGFPEMGLEGAGIGTFVSRFVCLGICVWAYMRYPLFTALKQYKVGSTWKNDARKILTMGAPIGGQITLEVAAFSLGAVIIGTFGDIPAAAHQIALNIAAVTYMIALGIASASTIRISNYRGANDFANTRQAAKAVLVCILVYELITASTFIALNGYLPTLYSSDSQVLALASTLLLYAAAFQVFDGLQGVAMGILRGMQDVHIPTVIAIFSFGVVALPTSYFCAHTLGLGPEGVWIGFVVGLFIASMGYMLRIRILSSEF